MDASAHAIGQKQEKPSDMLAMEARTKNPSVWGFFVFVAHDTILLSVVLFRVCIKHPSSCRCYFRCHQYLCRLAANRVSLRFVWMFERSLGKWGGRQLIETLRWVDIHRQWLVYFRALHGTLSSMDFRRRRRHCLRTIWKYVLNSASVRNQTDPFVD